MNILFVSALLPYPPYQGGQVRMYNLLKNLAVRHKITLLSFVRSEEEQQYVTKLSFCDRVTTVMRGHAWQTKYVLRAALGTKPFLYATYDSDEMRQVIAEELANGKYDLIHLEPSYVWPSLPQTDTPIVITEHNIESTIYRGFVSRFQATLLRPLLYWDVMKLWWWERHVWRKAHHVVTVSASDAQVVQKTIGNDRVSIVPNGVDLSQFTFKSRKKVQEKRVLFVGYFGWLQNRDALAYLLDALWPKITRQHPDATLRVVGNNLPAGLQQKIATICGIYVFEVDDIVKEYHHADLLLAPIRIGGGTRYKILEAMATGLPVVTTAIGASGLAVSDRQELLIADGISQTVQAVSEVLMNDTLRLAITDRARRVIEENYSWDLLAKKLEGAWEHVEKTSS